jgi:hypothetical protein
MQVITNISHSPSHRKHPYVRFITEASGLSSFIRSGDPVIVNQIIHYKLDLLKKNPNNASTIVPLLKETIKECETNGKLHMITIENQKQINAAVSSSGNSMALLRR